MRIFCTVFDKNYLVQGVALYNSLKQHSRGFRLYAFCMDSTAFTILVKMNLEDLIPVNIEELITPEVAEVRKRTSHGQFCWVCQPLVCRHVLDKFEVDMVTYLEADSLFFSDPEVLFEEMKGYSVSLVPHNFPPERECLEPVSGKFCVQFNVFRNDGAAREVLDYWKENCFRYNHKNTGSIPGQTCLDDWPVKFNQVRVIRNLGAGVAPWNIQRFRLEIDGSRLYVDGVSVVFYHFHNYGRYKNGDHELGDYPLTKKMVRLIYSPYVRALCEAKAMVQLVDPAFTCRREFEDLKTIMDVFRSFSLRDLRMYYRVIKKRILMPYNVLSDSFFSRELLEEKF